MDFKEFITRMTASAKDSKVHMMAFISDGQKIVFTSLGETPVIIESVAAAMNEHPEIGPILLQAIELLDKRNLTMKVINSEDEYNDYLIDTHLKSKELNEGKEGL